MIIFYRFNQTTECPVCYKKGRGKSVLIPIDGTAKGGIEECMQIHLKCINLRVMKKGNRNILYQVTEER